MDATAWMAIAGITATVVGTLGAVFLTGRVSEDQRKNQRRDLADDRAADLVIARQLIVRRGIERQLEMARLLILKSGDRDLAGDGGVTHGDLVEVGFYEAVEKSAQLGYRASQFAPEIGDMITEHILAVGELSQLVSKSRSDRTDEEGESMNRAVRKLADLPTKIRRRVDEPDGLIWEEDG